MNFGHEETQNPDTAVEDLNEPDTQKHITLVQETWRLLKGVEKRTE